MDYISTWIEKVISSRNIKSINKAYELLPETYHSIKEEITPYFHHIPKQTKTILDIGCGTGVHLNEIKKLYPYIHCTGVDISSNNITIAKKTAHSDLEFYNVDYLDFKTSPVDVIIAHGVLRDIPVEDNILYSKLAEDLKEGGLILFSIPYQCLHNYLFYMLRSIFAMLRSKWVDNALLQLHKYMYPGIDENVLQGRLEYIYAPIYRIMNKKMHKKLIKNNLHFVHSSPVPFHLSKYKYLLEIYKKQATP